jgi:hypothetical protein
MGNAPDKDRTEQHQRNQSLEELLRELNSLLRPPERKVEERFNSPRWPVLLIVGPPRSGTTLTLQWLAQTGLFGYPTNLISRFYAAPYIGAKIQRLLTDPEFDFNDEFGDLRQSIDFESTLGKTQGLLSPNEFWYFWRRFIPNEEPRYLEPEEAQQVDQEGFAASLAALESALDKPITLKGLILQFNLDKILEALSHKVIFVLVNRHPFFNIQSLLQARESHLGSVEKWYSVKPKEHEWLQKRSPVEQVAGQVYFTNRSLKQQLASVPQRNKLELPYESFCQGPGSFYSGIVDRLESFGVAIDQRYGGPKSFSSTNEIKVCTEVKDRICSAWSSFSERTMSNLSRCK